MTTTHDFSPLLPSNRALEDSQLPDKAVRLATSSAKLAGILADESRNTICEYMAVINSYYSNLIEGNKTRPHEIRAAQRETYSKTPEKHDLQQESVSHIQVQNWIAKQVTGQAMDQDKLYFPKFFKAIHREFYLRIPDSLCLLKNEKGDLKGKIIPGEWRTESVSVGQHVPPAPLMLHI